MRVGVGLRSQRGRGFGWDFVDWGSGWQEVEGGVGREVGARKVLWCGVEGVGGKGVDGFEECEWGYWMYGWVWTMG